MSKRSLIWLVCAIAIAVAVGLTLLYWNVRSLRQECVGVVLNSMAASEEPQLTLIFTGDLMQHIPQVQAATQQDGRLDYTSCFSRLRNYFNSADFVITNLETTLGKAPYTGYPQFRSPEILAQAMRQAGMDVAVVANNHICDRGGDGIRSTLRALEQVQMPYTGAFADTVADPMRHPLFLEKAGFRVALLNYTYGTNGIPVPRGCVVNLLDTLRMQQDVALAHQSGATHIVLFLHWGNEYELRPNLHQREIAAMCHRMGVDLVIGSHPHVVQSVETVKDSLGRICGITVFSMGNFVSNQRFPGTDGGISVRVTLHRRADSVTVYRPEYLIHWTAISRDSKSRSGRRYEIIPSYARHTIHRDQYPDFDRFMQRTRDYMAQHSSGFKEVVCDY